MGEDGMEWSVGDWVRPGKDFPGLKKLGKTSTPPPASLTGLGRIVPDSASGTRSSGYVAVEFPTGTSKYRAGKGGKYDLVYGRWCDDCSSCGDDYQDDMLPSQTSSSTTTTTTAETSRITRSLTNLSTLHLPTINLLLTSVANTPSTLTKWFGR